MENKGEFTNIEYGSLEHFQNLLRELPQKTLTKGKEIVETPITLAKLANISAQVAAVGVMEVVSKNFISTPFQGLLNFSEAVKQYAAKQNLPIGGIPVGEQLLYGVFNAASNTRVYMEMLNYVYPINLETACGRAMDAFEKSGSLTGQRISEVTPEIVEQIQNLNEACEPDGVIRQLSNVANHWNFGFENPVKTTQRTLEQLEAYPIEESLNLAAESGILLGSMVAVDQMLVFAEHKMNRPNPKDNKSWQKIKETARNTGLWAKPFKELSKPKQVLRGSVNLIIGSVLLGIWKHQQ